MIVGVAQLVVNVADLDAAASSFGGTESFRALDLPNDARKAPLQSGLRGRLDMVHLAQPEGVAVELTRYHGAPPAGRAAFTRTGPAAVTAATRDPEASRPFWTHLRFRPDGDALALRAPHPAWSLTLSLSPTDAAEPTTVDADGCVLVTLLTTTLERDLQALHDAGLLLRSTIPWTEQIADRQVRIAIVEGPGGELVELLEAPRR